jgi:hypothetical protein
LPGEHPLHVDALAFRRGFRLIGSASLRAADNQDAEDT